MFELYYIRMSIENTSFRRITKTIGKASLYPIAYARDFRNGSL